MTDPYETFTEAEAAAIIQAARHAHGGRITADQARRVLTWALTAAAQGRTLDDLLAALRALDVEDAA